MVSKDRTRVQPCIGLIMYVRIKSVKHLTQQRFNLITREIWRAVKLVLRA
jgi:hypothetical protein